MFRPSHPSLFGQALPRALAVACALAGTAGAQARDGKDNPAEADTKPRALTDVGIVDKPGSVIPPEVALIGEDGKAVRVGDLFDGRRPTIFVLAYYSCPMLCTLVLNGLNDGLKEVAWKLGDKYRVVTVSIDPRDTPEIAAAKRDNYVKDYGRDTTADGWRFLTATEPEVRKLADSLGFSYAWDEAGQQYAHAAAAFVATPDGRLSRTLYGVSFPERDLRLALVEASQGAVGSIADRILLFCYQYDSQARGYVLAADRLMRASAFVTVLAMAIWLRFLWRRERAASLRVKEV